MKKKNLSKKGAKRPLIGFIGQGFIGKNYSDDFEDRGFEVVRYSTDKKYIVNREKISECDMVFIAVPTPSTPQGFDDCIVREVIKLVGKGKIAVIKSTIIPGSTESIQKENPDIFVFHSPEFLTEKTARYDASNPTRNIIGMPVNSPSFRRKAKEVLSVLPDAPYNDVCQSREAELIKYGGNCWFYFKVIYINMLYDLAIKLGCNYEKIKQGMAADPRIGSTHLSPVHQGGRGAGGHCFIKDFAAFSTFYKELIGDYEGRKVLESLKEKNLSLLLNSKKDLDLLLGVYGKSVLGKKFRKM